MNEGEYPRLVLERELDETELPGLEEARPHALEVAQEADAPAQARSENAEAIARSSGEWAAILPGPPGPYHASRSKARASFVAFFHCL
jgi:hypothetical protein